MNVCPPSDVTPCTGAGPRLDLTSPPRGQRLLESSCSSLVPQSLRIHRTERMPLDLERCWPMFSVTCGLTER